MLQISLSPSRIITPLLLVVVAGCGGIVSRDPNPLEDDGGSVDPADISGRPGSDPTVPSIPDQLPQAVEIFGPDEAPYGVTYEEWIGRYWQWLLSIERSVHPREGGDCTLNQSEDVFFLATSRNGESAQRACTVPAGVPIFIALNASLNYPNAGCVPCSAIVDDPETWYANQEEELQSFETTIFMNTPFLTINGEEHDVGEPYYHVAADPFFVDVPDTDHYFGCIGDFPEDGCGWPPGTPRPFTSVGFGVMLHPLPPGDHTITFGAFGDMPNWSTDVTYTVTIE